MFMESNQALVYQKGVLMKFMIIYNLGGSWYIDTRSVSLWFYQNNLMHAKPSFHQQMVVGSEYR